MLDLDAQSELGRLHISVIDDHGEAVAFRRPELLIYHSDATKPLWYEPDPTNGSRLRGLWHFAIYREYFRPAHYVTVEFPDWGICVVSGIPVFPAARKRAVRSARRRARRCLACGYDLRASADRCPECGAPADHARQTGQS